MTGALERSRFGHLPGGAEVEVFTLRTSAGMEMRVIGYGGAILSLRVPDRDGRLGDVVLGYDDLAGYLADEAYLGALIGRHANRIREGRFSLDGRDYRLATNDGPNHLHGGRRGFHSVLWSVTPLPDGGPGVALTYTSPHGEEGYPGTLETRVTYRLEEGGEVEVEYAAVTDHPTPVNLTQHSYFNLSGDPAGTILGHELELLADHFNPVDATLIPSGELAPVEGTPFDFRRATAIGAQIGVDDVQLARAGGYDHNFVLRHGGGALRLAARVFDPTSGRVMEVHTTEPGIQFYSGNFLDGTIRGKGGRRYGHRSGLCLEPQHFPDALNHPGFPSTILRPGEQYLSRTVYRFTTA